MYKPKVVQSVDQIPPFVDRVDHVVDKRYEYIRITGYTYTRHPSYVWIRIIRTEQILIFFKKQKSTVLKGTTGAEQGVKRYDSDVKGTTGAE